MKGGTHMCISTPKIQQPAAPPKIETMDPASNVAASREADLRRRRQALDRMQTQGGGAMQGSEAGKTKMGV